MVQEFLNWWLGQLADLLPERLRLASRDAGGAIIAAAGPLSDTPDSVIVGLRRHGRETTLGRFTLGSDEPPEMPGLLGKPVVLRLAEEDVLAKSLVLPLAAERQLEQVLAFEIDRETPFAPEELYWGYHVTRRNRRTAQLWVRLVLISRAKLAPLLDALDRAGVRLNRAEIAAGPDRGTRLPLDVNGSLPDDSGRRRLLWPASACFVLLMLAAIILPFARQAVALARVERGIAAARIAAGETQKLRREVDRLTGSADLIRTERFAGGQSLVVLAALTGLLPSNTYLTDFTQQQGKVSLTGRSGGAARLIAILAGAEHLRNPTFAAPVTRIGASQLELFTITAEVVP